MQQDTSCTEDGPFFPQTPRYIIQNGFSQNQDILQSPDWEVIVVLLTMLFLCMLLLIVALVGAAICWLQNVTVWS